MLFPVPSSRVSFPKHTFRYPVSYLNNMKNLTNLLNHPFLDSMLSFIEDLKQSCRANTLIEVKPFVYI